MLPSFGRVTLPYLAACRALKTPTFALRPSSPRRSILLFVPSLVRTRADFAPTRKGTSTSSAQDANEAESTNVAHSRFLAEASPREKWSNDGADGPAEEAEEDLHDLPDGQGKLSPTSSHLFKLIIPLGSLTSNFNTSSSSSPAKDTVPPTVFLLHPTQPLSHVARLIAASLAPAQPSITFRSTGARGAGKEAQWSDATDVADFVRDAAHSREFVIHIAPGGAAPAPAAVALRVAVPTFADRTRFLRRRLARIGEEMKQLEGLKSVCDAEAHAGARRLARAGLAALVTYWAAVARLTFWDVGWDVMEPVTYLSGLTIVIGGYLWFLYQGREVSYSSVHARSVDARRTALYDQRGFDIERWEDLGRAARAVRAEIARIAEDYERTPGVGVGAGSADGAAGARDDAHDESGDGAVAAARAVEDAPPGKSDAEQLRVEADADADARRAARATPRAEASSNP